MRLASIIFLVLFGAACVGAEPTDGIDALTNASFASVPASNSADFAPTAQSSLLPPAAEPLNSPLFTQIPIEKEAAKNKPISTEPSDRSLRGSASAEGLSLSVTTADATQFPTVQLAPASPGAIEPWEVDPPSDSPRPFDPYAGFTADSTGFDYPFVGGFLISGSTVFGTRVLPASFQPQFAARFPGVNPADAVLTEGFALGLSCSPGGFGRFALNYRLLGASNFVLYVTANGPQDPLVAQELDPRTSSSDSPPPTILVPDSVGSCIVSSRLTLNQMDLTYTSPGLALSRTASIFGEIGSRAAVFFHEDYTTALTVFQQAKSTDSGLGPVAAIGFSWIYKPGQFYVKVEGGNLFSWVHQFDREMVVLNNAT